jgi:hypothetical protein
MRELSSCSQARENDAEKIAYQPFKCKETRLTSPCKHLPFSGKTSHETGFSKGEKEIGWFATILLANKQHAVSITEKSVGVFKCLPIALPQIIGASKCCRQHQNR